MVGRAGRGTQRANLFNQKGLKFARHQQRLGLLIEIGLVGRPASLGDAQKLVLISVGGVQVNLRGQVASRIHLTEHIQRGILGIPQVLAGVSVVHPQGEGFLIVAVCPDLPAFLAHDDGRSGVLAEGQHALGRNLGIAQKG